MRLSSRRQLASKDGHGRRALDAPAQRRADNPARRTTAVLVQECQTGTNYDNYVSNQIRV
jgi:hypothetical protein